MKHYLLIALSSAAGLYALVAGLQTRETWVHPFVAVFLAGAVAAGAGVVALVEADKRALRLRDQLNNDRRMLDWDKLTGPEKDVILELRKRGSGG